MSYMDNTTVAASSFIQDVMLDKEDPMEDSCGTFNPSNYHQTVAPPTRNWTKEDVVKQKFTYIRVRDPVLLMFGNGMLCW